MAIEGLSDLWQPLVYALLVGCVFAPLEWLWPERENGSTGARPRVVTDLGFATIGAVVAQILVLVTLGFALAYAAELRFRFGLHGLAAAPRWARLTIGLAIFELAGYGYHRLAHRLPILWRVHAVHHSAPEMDWLASFRQHPVEIALMTLVQNLPLVLLGVPLGEHAVIVLLLAVNTVFVHSNLRAHHPWLTWVIATSRFHHRHHAVAGPTANYASLLPILDRLFGTYSDERAEDVGLAEPTPASFVGLLAAPFRGSRSRAAGADPSPLAPRR